MHHCWLLCPISPVIVSYALNLLVGQAQVEADALPVSSHAPGNAQQVCLCQVPGLSIAQVQGREGEAIQGTGVLIPAGFQLLCHKEERERTFFPLPSVFIEDSVWPLSLLSEISFLFLGRKEVLGAEGSGCKKQGGLTLAVTSNAHCLRKISNRTAHSHSSHQKFPFLHLQSSLK